MEGVVNAHAQKNFRFVPDSSARTPAQRGTGLKIQKTGIEAGKVLRGCAGRNCACAERFSDHLRARLTIPPAPRAEGNRADFRKNGDTSGVNAARVCGT